MLLDGPCFLHDKIPGAVTLSRGGRNGRIAGIKFKPGGKMYGGIEKDTKTVE
jgi:hypothetical protein